MDFRLQIDSLSSDSLLYDFSPDSIEAREYSRQLVSVAHQIVPTDSTLKAAIPRIRALQARIEVMVSAMNSGLEEIERHEERVYANSLGDEVPLLWAPIVFSRPFGDILQFSKAKVVLGLRFYFRNNVGKLFLLGFLILIAASFLRSLKKKAIAADKLGSYRDGHLILRHPVLSAILITLTACQFIFNDPPFVFNFLIWTTSAICLTIIFRGFIYKYWMQVWLIIFLLFVLTCLNNLVLQASRTGRWIMISIALATFIVCLVTLSRGHRKELRERSILYFIGFVAFLEATSIVLNLAGRYNLPKALLVSGLVSVVVGVLLVWTVRLVDEGLKLASELYKVPEGNFLYVDFEKVGKKIPRIFYVLIAVGWFVIFGRNFYAFRFLTEPLSDFLYDQRTIGEFTFAIINLVLFFVVLFLSGLLSKLVSFLGSESNSWQDASSKNKPGIGSWILLIRIFIITMGMLLALAAAGIPMDKAAIVLGALGVGIGLGLQSLVNNLVSGLIIAFDKPVSVGDVVEIAGKSGTIKTIGFRSSILYTYDGADVVIPNGDLLNAHLVNWTRGNTYRRVEVKLGIEFNSDIDKVKELIYRVLESHDRVLKSPAPIVLANEFGDTSIKISVYFWVSHPREWLSIRSEIITAINALLKENEIELGVPQQDIYLRTEESIPELAKKDKEKK